MTVLLLSLTWSLQTKKKVYVEEGLIPPNAHSTVFPSPTTKSLDNIDFFLMKINVLMPHSLYNYLYN